MRRSSSVEHHGPRFHRVCRAAQVLHGVPPLLELQCSEQKRGQSETALVICNFLHINVQVIFILPSNEFKHQLVSTQVRASTSTATIGRGSLLAFRCLQRQPVPVIALKAELGKVYTCVTDVR